MTLSEKVAYFKGLVEGLNLERDSREGKLWLSLSDLISDISAEVADLKDTTDGYADRFDEITSELAYLEEVTGDLDTDGGMSPELFKNSECSGDCEACGLCGGEGDEEDEDYGELVAYAEIDTAADSDDFGFSREYVPGKTADGFISYVNNDLPSEEELVEEEPEDIPEDDEEENSLYNVTCPLCGKIFSCDQNTVDRGFILCPGCGKRLEFTFEDDEE